MRAHCPQICDSSPGQMSTAARSMADPEIKKEWEKETATVLKQMGFPSVDSVNHAVALLPRVTTCLTRRLQSLGEFILELEKADGNKAKGQTESILTKISSCSSELSM